MNVRYRNSLESQTAFHRKRSLILAACVMLIRIAPIFAVTSIWTGPGTDFNTANNWNNGVPTDVAAFNIAAPTSLSISSQDTLNGLTFNQGASAYTLTIPNACQALFCQLTLQGAGVTNNSNSTQTLVNNGLLNFTNTAAAGNVTINNSYMMTFADGSNASTATINNGGQADFNDHSSAGIATILNTGVITFSNMAIAGSATINNNGGAYSFTGYASAGNAQIITTAPQARESSFTDWSTAANATLSNSGLSITEFSLNSSAGNAILTTQSGGEFGFLNDATAGNALITNNNQGLTSFGDTSNAGSAVIVNNNGGVTDIGQTSTAGLATITNNRGGTTYIFNSATAGNATVANESGGSLVFEDNADGGLANIFNASGSTTTFSGSSFADHAILMNNGGNIIFANLAGAGQATITNNNGAQTFFNDASTAGNATITNNNGGSLYFLNNATAGNATLINNAGGTVDISGLSSSGLSVGSLSGAGSFILGSKNLSVDGNNVDSNISGVISGVGGSLTKIGTGVLTLGTTNTYSGGTSINGGTLAIFNDNNLGGVSGGLAFNGGTLRTLANVSSNRNITLNAGGGTIDSTSSDDWLLGNVNGSGRLTKIGTGTLWLTGVNTYTGGTSINGGDLIILNDNNLGDSSGDVSFDGGTIKMAAPVTSERNMTLDSGGGTINTLSYDCSLSGNIGGMGSLTLMGAGTLTLSGANTYQGATFVNEGVLQAGVPNAFSRFSAVTLANDPTVILDLNSFDQTIGSLSGGGNVTLGSARLTTGGDNTSTTYAGIISGSGGLTKTGSGTMTLTGANTYTGSTILDGGTLFVGDSGTSPSVRTAVTAAPGLPLGNGDFILNNGTLKSAAGGFGVISVAGDYSQNGGTLELKLGGGSNSGLSDELVVGGAAHVGGKLQLDLTGGTFIPGKGTTLQLVQASSIDGNFDVLSGPAGLGFTFDPGTGGLDVSQNTFAPFAVTANQAAVASSIDQFSETATGDFASLVGSLDALSAAQLPSALNELSPQRFEMYSDIAFRSAAFTNQELGAHLGRLRAGASGLDMAGMISHPSGPEALLADASVGRSSERWDFPDDIIPGAPTLASAQGVPSTGGGSSFSIVPDLGAFVSGDAIFANQDGTQDLQKSNFTTSGTMGGLDYRVSDHAAVGVLLGYTHTDASLDNEGSTANVTSYSPGLYATYFQDHFYVNGLLSYASNSYSADRNIIFTGLNRTASSSTHGDQVMASMDTGMTYRLGDWNLGPTAGMDYTRLNVDGFTETGAGTADLIVKSQVADSFRSRLGGRFDRPFKTGSVIWDPEAHAAWQHEYLDDSHAIVAGFDQAGLGIFTVQTTAPQRDSALLGAGISAQLTKAITLSLNYDLQAGQSRFFAQSVQGGGSLRF